MSERSHFFVCLALANRRGKTMQNSENQPHIITTWTISCTEPTELYRSLEENAVGKRSIFKNPILARKDDAKYWKPAAYVGVWAIRYGTNRTVPKSKRRRMMSERTQLLRSLAVASWRGKTIQNWENRGGVNDQVRNEPRGAEPTGLHQTGLTVPNQLNCTEPRPTYSVTNQSCS